MSKQQRLLVFIVAGIMAILVFATRVSCQIMHTPVNAQTFNDGVPITLGLRFTPKSDVTIVGVRFWKQFDGPAEVSLWDGNLKVVSDRYTGANGWAVVQMNHKVKAGRQYTATYSSIFNFYSYAPGAIPAGSAELTYDQTAFIYQNDTYPVSSNGSNYLVEPVTAVGLPPAGVVRDTIYIRDTLLIRDTFLLRCPDTTWVFADGYDTVGARFPDYRIYGQLEFSMPLNQKVRFTRRIEAVWRREEWIDGQWIEK